MIEIIQKRLDAYKSTNPVEEEQAIKEIIQEVALYALWRAGFFEVAAFQGGTSLRILYGLPRFSSLSIKTIRRSSKDLTTSATSSPPSRTSSISKFVYV